MSFSKSFLLSSGIKRYTHKMLAQRLVSSARRTHVEDVSMDSADDIH